MYFNSYCSSLFKPQIIKIGQSSNETYNINILNVQESTAILNACTKKSGNSCLIEKLETIYSCMSKRVVAC